ncbi:putative P-loop containing nucleoside triphosphate hydrolase, leucine-rich repeat domain, L [Rosa chinensis]|uniref:Putative P-loop containing nucleoside triphosphate hydrolase, leucine-rich repeat domain, L n=1 Tax=Rosa chinensis TaxID=74649 RepID=A0A2P6QBN8_ROSCH|nr:disease resistance protein At4g27190 [Rosa chinensis]PRQ31597.1 putative P-loop containing nucleoside triphosphate hydrolase, leucine-rich repeat domain, L [Rosa chinensis]
METLGAFFVEVCKSVTKFMWSKFATLKKFPKNIQTLKKELQSLNCRRDEITDDIDIAKLEGKFPARQVVDWLKKVEAIECAVEEEIDRKVQPVLQEVHINASVNGQGCLFDSNMHQRYHLSKTAAKKCDEVKQLITESYNFPTMWDALRLRDTPIQHIPAPSLVGQKAQEKLKQLMEFLADNKIRRIAVYGMGGSGKTTLVKTLNNQLQSSASKLCDMVIWIPVSNDLDVSKVQSRVAERLNLAMNAEQSIECRACRLHQALKSGKRFLLILDDVWEKIDLDTVGIPQGDDQANCKIIMTTRSLAVCREMMTDKELKMELLNEEEAWNLFARNAGIVVESEHINPLARAIASECGGLPLAIETMGKSMRDKTMIQLWKNALCQLKHSASHYGSFDKVHLRLELSYNSLPSKILKRCFLFCSLYPENFLITARELICGWIADGLIIEHPTLEESFNDGIAKIEYLKDSCMLEQGECIGTVKMHSVLREVALWISSNRKETGFFSSSLLGMQEKLESSIRGVSFMKNSITSLPSRFSGCSNLTVLFLQCNPLYKIPDGFFRELGALRFLNLSSTQISSLPSSLLQLAELHTLLLRDCSSLENLPQIGALYKLQVLDLSGTHIRELPKDMGTLTHLRDLNLSRTNHLESIIAGSISGLYSLEALDMSSSAYKWDLERNVEGAPFDEILSLQGLSVLHIRLDTVNCVALDSDGSWFGRLKEFSIWIGPRSCDSSYLPTQHDEKRVILRGVDLLQSGLEGLLYSASSLDLVTCGGISSLSDLISSRKLGGLPNLKFLTISNCDCITSLLIGEETLGSTLSNLEHLTLNCLNNLETMADRIVPRGCLGKLKMIEVMGCRRLKTLISFTLLRRVQNVEEIKVSDCRRMKKIIVNINLCETLPKLKYIELRNMDSLTAICSKAAKWSALERIEVSDCPKLEKLPLRAQNAANLKEIRGDLSWWNGLRWENDGDKISLEQRFQACADSTLLLKEDTEA